jgi:predicted dehydrogenase
MVQKLKAGIIGLGVGKKHFEAFNRHPSCQVSSVYDFSEKKLENFSNVYPDIRAVSYALNLRHCLVNRRNSCDSTHIHQCV